MNEMAWFVLIASVIFVFIGVFINNNTYVERLIKFACVIMVIAGIFILYPLLHKL